MLEHVSAVEKVLSEIRRVLKPEGLFVFDTINRTWFSKLLSIKIMQNWRATSVLPPDFHVWDKFIKPDELKAMLVRQGLEPQEFVGLPARGNPLKHIQMLRKRKRGEISVVELGRYLADHLAYGKDMSALYAGFARRARD